MKQKQYIDKGKVVAKIKRLKSSLSPNFYEYDYDAAKVELLEKIEKFLDTLEVKEVDLEKESEDERVKRILHSISSKMSFHLHDIFTDEEFQCFDAWSNIWLEKQNQDAEKKELKKIHVIDEGKAEMDYCFTKMMNGEKVSSAWSEEDEEMLENILDDYDDVTEHNLSDDIGKVMWLKSLKERMKGE